MQNRASFHFSADSVPPAINVGGFDLLAWNINRGRDHGLPRLSYCLIDFKLIKISNKYFRAVFGLKTAGSGLTRASLRPGWLFSKNGLALLLNK
jgi:hypothetical protein